MKIIGYANKQRAAWAAKLIDAVRELDGIIQTKAAFPRVLLTTPEMLEYLQRE